MKTEHAETKLTRCPICGAKLVARRRLIETRIADIIADLDSEVMYEEDVGGEVIEIVCTDLDIECDNHHTEVEMIDHMKGRTDEDC